MKLPVTNWDHPSGATDELVEFPDEPIQKFVAWLFSTKQWRENPEQVFQRFRRLQEELADWKNKKALKEAETRRKRLDALAKARETKAARAAQRNGAA